MSVAVAMQESEMRYVQEMNRYIADLKKKKEQFPEESRKEAIEALIRTGVADENGEIKKKIVTWE